MARGYPDYFGYSTFPVYGVPDLITGSGVIGNTDPATDVVLIEKKGKLCSGFLGLLFEVNIPSTVMITYIDGVKILQQGISDHRNYGFAQKGSAPMYLASWDAVNKFITWIPDNDITFGYEFRVTVTNRSLGDCTYVTQLSYYKIQ